MTARAMVLARNAVLSVVAIATVTIAGASPAPLAGQTLLLDRLDRRVESAMERWAVPGVGVAAVVGDSVAVARGYGVRRVGSPDPVGPGTAFALGSVTKGVTGIVLGLLEAEGIVGWREPLAPGLPGVVLRDGEARVTLDDVLTHRTGLPRTLFLFYGRTLSHRQVVRRLRHVEPVRPLRDAFGYQNVAYSLAGDVAAAATGSPFATVLRRRLLEPLAMEDTGLGDPDDVGRHDAASPHVGAPFQTPSPVAWNAPTNVAAAGALHTSARDLRAFLRYLLGVGAEGTPALPDEVRVAVMEPRVLVPPRDPVSTLLGPVASRVGLIAYGRGWFVNMYRGERMVWVAGDIDGMSALVALLPDHRTGIAVVSNRQLPQLLPFAVATGFLDDVLGVDADEATVRAYGELTGAMAAAREAGRVEPIAGWEGWDGPGAAGLTGRYRHPAYGDLRIGAPDGDGPLRFRLDGRIRGTLAPGPDGRLVVLWDDPVLAWGIPLTVGVRTDEAGEPVLVVPAMGLFRRVPPG